MAPPLSNGKGKRQGGGQLARAARLAQQRPVAAGGAILLLILVTTLLLHHKGPVDGTPGPGLSRQAEALDAARRAKLLEQSALLEDTDRLAAEVSELARELETLRSGVDPTLTQRERLWHEKEAEGQAGEGGEGEKAAGAGAGAGEGGGEGQAGFARGPGGRLIPEKLQLLLLDKERKRGQLAEAAAAKAAEAFAVGGGDGMGAVGGLLAAQRAQQAQQPSTPPRPDPVVVELSEEEVARRREEIVEATRHAWGGYVEYAWGFDELAPVSKGGKNGFGGLGATIIDSLDTLLMMGLREEYDRALGWIASNYTTSADFDASVFETIIRVVGGFLAAHELTGDDLLLRKSEEVAQRLMPAYNTSTGIPFNTINLKNQKVKNPNWNLKASTLAEFGTHQLEFFKLSQKTGNATYDDLAEATIRFLYDRNPGQGLMPLFVNPATGKFTNRKVSFGALGDSYYEYLLKLWVLKGRPPGDISRAMWEQAMDEMIERLVFTSKEGFVYIAEFDRFQVKHKMDHLVCFVPGMLALGVHTGAVTGDKAKKYMEVAEGVTHTCWQMYHTQPTGLSPEYIMFNSMGLKVGAAYNLLRPEALEAFWYMWRMTRDWKYRAWAWEVFQAFQEHCKTEAGYSGVKDVRRVNVTHDDTQQSFFLAETLKYLYLIFSPDEALSWDEWVLNTEAHPLRIAGRSGRARAGRAQSIAQQAAGRQSKGARKSRFGFGLW